MSYTLFATVSVPKLAQCEKWYLPLRLLLCLGLVIAPSPPAVLAALLGLLGGLGGGLARGLGGCFFTGGGSGTGLRTGDFLRKTDGEGIWISI
jgi:hypothetical protein